MRHAPPPRKGRGAISNPGSRYEAASREAFDDGWGSTDQPAPPLQTTVSVDTARSIITYNRSPDVPFDRSINAYRGCEHGCVYCFARPTHAFYGLSPGLDFESRLFYKPDAAKLLRQELGQRKYRCQPIAMGTNTDPYQPIERDYRVTRQLIEVLAEYRHPLSIVTKSALIERDIDLLAPMAAEGLVEVYLSVTTLRRDLARRLEPRAASPQRRIDTIQALRAAGIPTGVLVAPLIPVLNDGEIEDILMACKQAGALWAHYMLLRLPLEVRDLFTEWLTTHEALKATHIMQVLRDMREGQDYDPAFGRRMTGTGHYAELIKQRFYLACKKLALNQTTHRLETGLFTPPAPETAQMSLF